MAKKEKMYTCLSCNKPTSRDVLKRYAGVCARDHKRASKLPPPRKA